MWFAVRRLLLLLTKPMGLIPLEERNTGEKY